MYDAVNLFAASLHGLVATQSMGPTRISCDNMMKPWVHGFSLIRYMRVVRTFRGIGWCIRTSDPWGSTTLVSVV